MAATLTTAQREAMYRRVMAGIPTSFLDPDHPDNQAVIGAIAYAIGYAKALYGQLEAGLFLDTSDNSTIGADGLTNLQRWGIWLKMEQVPGETAAEFRSRLEARLFSPRCTLDVIESAVTAATGLAVTIEEPGLDVIELNGEDPWHHKRIMGALYGPMAIVVVTKGHALGLRGGTTAVLPRLMPLLRGAGCHWRHLEVVSHTIALLLEGKQTRQTSIGRNLADLWPPELTPTWPPNLYALPLHRRVIFTGASYLVRNVRTNWGAGTMLVEGAPGGPFSEVLAFAAPPGAPVANFDDSLTLWDESVWPD